MSLLQGLQALLESNSRACVVLGTASSILAGDGPINATQRKALLEMLKETTQYMDERSTVVNSPSPSSMPVKVVKPRR
jgi:hypothetical protein